MLRVRLLGTGSGGSIGAGRKRAHNLVELDGALVVVDCGTGCHYSLSQLGVLPDVDYYFVTHGHVDHFLGLPDALVQAEYEGRRRVVKVYVPRYVENFLKSLWGELGKLSYPLEIHRLHPGAVVENGAFRLGAYPVCHPTAEEAYGFRLESRGDSVFFSGDTLPGCEGVLRGGEGVDIFIHEATCSEEFSEICRLYGHSTTLQALAVAEAARPGMVVLTHIDQRLNPTVYRDVAKFGAEAVVAEDNTVVT
ncbi:MAG: MBL fold metallo-hydrolase [Pyrobaculum sp.]